MKEATVHIRLSKDHSLFLKRVTPIEAMLLTAEHHKNVGGAPINLAEDPTAVKDEVDTYRLDEKVTVATDGKQTITTVKVPDNRTEDQELDRLKGKYGVSKVKGMMTEVRDFPKTFKEAIERGIKISLPSNSLSTTKLM